jgi:hypothetical protein
VIKLTLTGPRGDNPLGFLTAVGVLAALDDAGYPAKLAWDRFLPALTVPSGLQHSDSIDSLGMLVDVLHKQLRRDANPSEVETRRARREMEEAQTTRKKKADEIRARRLRGAERNEAFRVELGPLDAALEETTRRFKALLATSSADPSVTLGKNLTVSNRELIDHALTSCKEAVDDRRWADLASAFGMANPAAPAERMLASPWALINGAGHQNFLSSVEALMIQCDATHLLQAVAGPWIARDAGNSLRLDMQDDRRYALLDRNPTAAGHHPLTLWGANRLAFEALRFFPCVPATGGMAVIGWRSIFANGWRSNCRVRWPLWTTPISASTVHAVLGLRDTWDDESTSARRRLRGLGIVAVLESQRIAVASIST